MPITAPCFAFLYSHSSLPPPFFPSPPGSFPHPCHGRAPRANAPCRIPTRANFYGNGGDEPCTRSEDNAAAAGVFAVPVLWSTYGVAVRYLYGAAPDLSPLFLSFLEFLISTTALGAVALLQSQPTDPEDSSPSSEPTIIRAPLFHPGVELGVYSFLGSTSQLISLHSISAARNTLLVQLSSVFVPLLDWARGGPFDRRAIFRAVLAVAGVGIATGAGPVGAAGAPALPQVGDALAIAAAGCYAVATLRLGDVARKEQDLNTRPLSTSAPAPRPETPHRPAELALVRTATQLGLSSMVLLVLTATDPNFVWVGGSGASAGPLSRFDAAVGFMSDNAATLVWVGTFATSLASWFQVSAQAVVSPALASAVYALQPVLSGALSALLLGEAITWQEAAGTALVVGACLIRDDK